MRFLLSGGALPVAVLGLLAAVTVCVASARADETTVRRWRRLAQVFWTLALVGVGVMTLGLSNPRGGGVNIVPFTTIHEQLTTLGPGMALFNIVGNLMVLVPFGLLARPAFGWSVAVTTTAAFAFCTVIEVSQGLLGRSADIDDVILNTVGGLVGAVLSALIVAVAAPRRSSTLRAATTAR